MLSFGPFPLPGGEPPRPEGCAVFFWAFIIAVIAALFGLCWYVGGAQAHEHGGILYPPSCCNSAATHAYGDCAPIDDRYVSERADGYHINLPVGAHPKLVNKGYVGVVPFSGVRQPLDNQYHICLSPDGGHRYCFFPKPGAV